MSKLSFSAELILQATGIELAPHEQSWRGWFWHIDGLIDWDGPYDTPDEALAVALRSIVARARAQKAEEDAAINGPDEDFAAYQRITERAGALRRFTSQPTAAPVPSDEEISEAIRRALDDQDAVG